MAKIHIHTKYSLLDAIIEPEQLVKLVKEQDGEKATLCVTEHGNVFSNVEIYKLCKQYGVKYLYGCEMYVCNDVTVTDKNNKYYHLVVVAKNETGRLNLNRLVSESNKYKYYGKPRIDFNLLCKYKEGLIVLSACMAGEVQRALKDNDKNKAKTIALKYKQAFQDDYYLEYQSHSDKVQQALNRQVVDLANELDIKYIVTTDAHYLTKEEQKYHNIFVRIGQAREVGETYNDCYIQSDDEMLQKCKSTTHEENLKALATTNEIADKCNVELPLSAPIMSHVEVPKEYKSEFEYLKSLCMKGWYNKGINKKNDVKKYQERLVYELNAIREMGFEGYFLLVYGYVNCVKRRGIARGSGGGSLVAYLVNIVDIDPIEYDLYFERFIDVGALNLLRDGTITKKELKLPDFDIDYSEQDREKAIAFVREKYGDENVASLGAFQYIKAKRAIKDIGRVLKIPFEVTNEMTSKFDDESIAEVLEQGLLNEYKSKYPELFEYAQRLSNLPKSFSAHPCGKIIANEPVIYYNATYLNDNNEVVLQGDMHTADDLGLVKVDFLGLTTLDVIYDTLDMIGKDYSYISPHNLDLEDKEVWENFSNGYTQGIFQFESSGIQDMLKRMKCDSITDLSVSNALYRPGSIKFIDSYIDRKNGVENFEYLHEDLKPILQSTYGIIVFQEQLIEIGRLAKLRNPDELRKATAKKKPELLEKIKPELFNGLRKRGWSEKQLNTLWNLMIDFANYSFNKSHATAYALTAYICMLLKTHYTKEFCCAWLNSVVDKPKKMNECIKEIRRLGIKLEMGKYNNCSAKCKVYQNGILYGVANIKYCNATISEKLMKLKQPDEYESFIALLDDINANTDINSKQLNILISMNFFSDFGNNAKLLRITQFYNGIKVKNPNTDRMTTAIPSLRNCKKISKTQMYNLERYDINEDVVKKYCGKETEKQYSEIDNVGLLKEIAEQMPDDKLAISEMIPLQLEYLQYTDCVNSKFADNLYIVLDVRLYNPQKLIPYFTLYQLSTGKEITAKINRMSYYCDKTIHKYDVIEVFSFVFDFKKKKVNDKWVSTDERRTLLDKYDIVKKYQKTE